MRWPSGEKAKGPERSSLLLPPCLPGHSCTGQPTMASDHHTQAGKPQPLNPKVGTMQGGGGGQAELIPQTQSPFCKVGLASAFPSLPLCPWASVSPTCTLILKALPWHARTPTTSFLLRSLKLLCFTPSYTLWPMGASQGGGRPSVPSKGDLVNGRWGMNPDSTPAVCPRPLT